MKKFNWKVFKRITFIPLLILKICIVTIGLVGLLNIVLIVAATIISLCIVMFALHQGFKKLPGKDIPEEMKYVVRASTVVILVDIYPIGKLTVAVIQEPCEFGKKPDIRKAFLSEEKEYQLVREKHYRVGKNQELFECESREIGKPAK